MSTPEIQGRLCLKNIIVTGCPHSNMKFDEAGLQTLWPLDSPASIQGTTSTIQFDAYFTCFQITRFLLLALSHSLAVPRIS